MDADGVLEYTIQQSVDRIPKTAAEIQTETEEYEERAARDQSIAPGFEPNPYHPLISLTGVDSEGNLWVQQYTTGNEVLLDVFDPTGELVYTVTSEDSMSCEDIEFQVDPYGILGAVAESEEYPRIYLFEVDPR